MALEEGKKRIPFYGMLILGEARVGKTSLYRQLVGKVFRDDLKSTEGIDNNIVALVDERNIVGWQENNISGHAFANAAGEKTLELMPKKLDTETTLPSQEALLKAIRDIEKYLKSCLPARIYLSILNYDGTSKPHPQEVPRTTRTQQPQQHFVYPSIVQQPPASPPKKKMKQEVSQVPHQPRSTPAEVKKEEPERVITPPPQERQPQEEIDQSRPSTPESTMEDTDEAKQVLEEDLASEMDTEVTNKQDTVGITHRDGDIIAGIVKGRVKNISKEKISLVTLDFAGQPEYRPMHHCFITRRACYLVVFKLSDMAKHMKRVKNSKNQKISDANNPHDQYPDGNPWEAFRYWIHSIHAHIFPPEKEGKEEINKSRRIILVGTHRENVEPKDLKDIDEFLAERIGEDNRCLNHVTTVKKKLEKKLGSEFPTNYYIPVENSWDAKCKQDYLSESGTKMVQIVIDSMTDLPFLKEEYPIKWLKFKERIEVTAASTPVLTIEALKNVAAASRIHDEEQQKLAIKFLHDSGKLICLGMCINT